VQEGVFVVDVESVGPGTSAEAVLGNHLQREPSVVPATDGDEVQIEDVKEKNMKVVVTSQGKELVSGVDPRFGRANWLIVINTETGESETHDNAVNLSAAQGAGIQTAKNVADLQAEAVITGNVGPNAFRTLEAAGIRVFLVKNQTVQEAVDSFKADTLKQVDQANVQGHWS
jgi:predicted Fe-Mo cluster-binding NifX family protein